MDTRGMSLFVLGLVFFGSYVLSLVLHPMVHCRACKGTPRFYGSVFKRSFRFCHTCGNTGRHPRAGARALVALGFMKDPERAGSLGWLRRNRRTGR